MVNSVIRMATGKKGLFFLVILIVVPGISWSQRQVLQEIVVKEKNGDADIQINLAIPVRHIKHFPIKSGKILQIQLEILTKEEIKRYDEESGWRESLVPPVNDLVPLVHVTYEGNVPGGPYLTLRFRYAVEYTVLDGRSTDNFHRIHIIVKRDRYAVAKKQRDRKSALAMSGRKLDELMRDARRKLTKGESGIAIQLFRKILRLPQNKYSQDAKELLGLARERKGQKARARLEYQEYLRLYPKGEGAERVKQRMSALAIQKKRRKKLTRLKKSKGLQFRTNGRFSQRLYYRDSQSRGDYTSLTSYLNVSSRIRSGGYDIRGYVNASDSRYLDQDNGITRLGTIYVDVKNKERGIYGKVGRQSSSGQGAFGRFDGIWMGYQVKPKLQVNTTLGKAVNYYPNSRTPDRSFFSTSAELGTFRKYWNANAFFIGQRVEAAIDRMALGGDLRFTHKKFSVFNFFDYDVYYSELNIYSVRGNWTVNRDIRLNGGYSHRRSPMASTSNAIRQEAYENSSKGVLTLERLLDENDAEAIRKKVKNMHAISELVSFGISYSMHKNLQVNADMSLSRVSEQPAVEKIVTPNEFTSVYPESQTVSFATQVVYSNLLVERDAYVAGIRITDGERSDSRSVFVNTRIPILNKWYINPRFRFTNSKHQSDDSENNRYSVSARTSYRWKRRVRFNIEIGYDKTDWLDKSRTDYESAYARFGYSASF